LVFGGCECGWNLDSRAGGSGQDGRIYEVRFTMDEAEEQVGAVGGD